MANYFRSKVKAIFRIRAKIKSDGKFLSTAVENNL